MRAVLLLALAGAAISAVSGAARAEEEAAGGNQPYIDQLKQDLPPPTAQEESYTAKRKRQLEQAAGVEGPAPGESYIDLLKATDPKAFEKKEEPGSYSEALKARETQPRRSAIQDLNEGRSELSPNKAGKIRGAFGFKVGVSLARNITASGDAGKQSFDAVYGTTWAPDLMGFYEWQPFHSEIWGNVGLVFTAGLSYFRGNGRFKFSLLNPVTGESFGSTAQTEFRFVAAPVLAGGNYRFNLARWVRPYAQASIGVVGFQEVRSDGAGNNRGISKVMLLSGGVNLMLDQLFSRASWDLYAENGVKHYYLTVDYEKMVTLASDVSFGTSGISLGLTYEL